MKLVEEFSSFSKVEDEVSTIAANHINMANTATTPTAPLTLRATRPTEREIIIREPTPEKPKSKEVPKRKRKKKIKRASTTTSRDSTPSPIRRARRNAEENKLRVEA